jgi:DNA repair protein RadC
VAPSLPSGANGCRHALEELISLTHPDRAPQLAERLVSRFGSLGETLAAGRSERLAILEEATSVEVTLQCVRSALHQILRGRLMERPVLRNEQRVLDYLRGVMAYEKVERFRVLFLNAANELLADEVLGVGTVSTVHIYPREIIKRCLELGATAIFLAHNHPSGAPAPSQADREMTRRIAEAARWIDVVVHDHLVVARNGCTSFRRAGYL